MVCVCACQGSQTRASSKNRAIGSTGSSSGFVRSRHALSSRTPSQMRKSPRHFSPDAARLRFGDKVTRGSCAIARSEMSQWFIEREERKGCLESKPREMRLIAPPSVCYTKLRLSTLCSAVTPPLALALLGLNSRPGRDLNEFCGDWRTHARRVNALYDRRDLELWTLTCCVCVIIAPI